MKKKFNLLIRGALDSRIKKILMYMKLTCLVILLGVVQTFADKTTAQTTHVSVNLRNATVETVLQSVEEQTDFYFLYSRSLIDVNRKVDLQVRDVKIADLLNILFDGTTVSWEINGRQIVLLGSETRSEQQQKTISGKVTDSSGTPLPGVTVMVIGTTTGVITDANGTYSISNVRPNEILRFSFVGMKTEEIAVAGKSMIDVIMREEAVGIEEVVAVGYGTQKKVNLTGSVSAINGNELKGMPSTNVSNMIQGRLPGVTVIQSTGQPGNEGTLIKIRGIGTMNNSTPLILVDGLESSLDYVNPNDIGNISVLKDAAAASIYGTRGANGVLLITTKRGNLGTPVVNYNGYVGFQNVIRNEERLSSAEYARLYNEGKENEGLNPVYTDEEIEKFSNGSDPYNYPNTNWQKLLLTESGFTQNHNLNFTGGTESSRYMVSLGYYNQEGIVKDTNHDRYNLRFNLDSKINSWLNFGVNSSLTRREIIEPTNPYTSNFSEFFRQANRIPNTYLNKYEDGSFARHIDGNPIAWLEAGGKKTSKYSNALGSVFGEVKIIDGLTLKGSVGVNCNFNDTKTHVVEVEYGDGTTQAPDYVKDYLARELTVTLQSVLNYEKKIDKNNFKGMLGISRESYSYNLTSAYRKNLPSNELTDLDAGSSEGMSNSGTSLDSRLGSYFGRLNYNYAEKYLFEANLRIDGSSKFAKEKRWGAFPSLSVGWRVSEEVFMKQIEWISNLKFRGSWGQLGNDRIDDYQYLEMITLGQNYNFGGTVSQGAAQTTANNKSLEWEKTTELDFGLDFDIFKGMITAAFDYYNRYTDDILTVVPISYIYGLDAPTTNAGAMRNEGIEIQLGHQNNVGNFKYGIDGYIAFNKNKVEKYENPSKGSTIRAEGVAWDSYYGYKCIGIFQTDEEANASPIHSANVKAGDLKFENQNEDEKIDGDDRVVLGNYMPNITYSFNLNLAYKGFDLRAFFQGAADVKKSVTGEYFWPFVNGCNAHKAHLDRTIVEDGNVVSQGQYPRTLISQTHNQVNSSFNVVNAGYLRLKNLQLGYNISPNLLKNLHLSKMRIYASGQNLLTLTKLIKEYDPEVGTSNYPQTAFYILGLDVTF